MVNDKMFLDTLSLKCLWEKQTEMSHLIWQMQKLITITQAVVGVMNGPDPPRQVCKVMDNPVTWYLAIVLIDRM